MLQCSKWHSECLLWPAGTGWRSPEETRCAGQFSADSVPSVPRWFLCVTAAAWWLYLIAETALYVCQWERGWLDEWAEQRSKRRIRCLVFARSLVPHTWRHSMNSSEVIQAFGVLLYWQGSNHIFHETSRFLQWFMMGASRCHWHYSTGELLPSLCLFSWRCFIAMEIICFIRELLKKMAVSLQLKMFFGVKPSKMNGSWLSTLLVTRSTAPL